MRKTQTGVYPEKNKTITNVDFKLNYDQTKPLINCLNICLSQHFVEKSFIWTK